MRALLYPELQAGKIAPEEAKRVLEQDVVESPASAEQEVERYAYRAPGQPNSYYGFARLVALRIDTQAALGTKFDRKRFHASILAQGLLPPDLLRNAVMQDFVAAEVAAGALRPAVSAFLARFLWRPCEMGLPGQVVFLWRHGAAHGIHLGASRRSSEGTV